MSKDAGYLVETKSGKKGRTYHREKKINNKTIVHIDEIDTPMLCDSKSLKIIGFID